MNHVAIYGGLGNQMFQFALAISMDASGIPTKISTNEYVLNRHYHGFELLKAFKVPVAIKDRLKVFAVNRARDLLVETNGSYVRSFVKKIVNHRSNVYNEKKEYEFDQSVFEQEDSFLVGTWQHIRYFEGQSELIREVFNFNKPKDLVNLKIANDIQKGNSVAVHIRRGDFMKPGNMDTRMIIDSSDYYNRAFELIESKVENPLFYIFSDDIKWAKENFKGNNCVFMTHNKGSNSYLDMYLMSLCKHFIIANSSFSWWPAWLANYKSKQVIMPYPWVKNSECKGMYPQGWIPLELFSVPSELSQ